VQSTYSLGNIGPLGDGPDGAVEYYERSTCADALAVGREVPDEDRSMGTWYVFGDHAPRDLDGAQLTPEDLRQALAGEWRGQSVRNADAPDRQMGWDLAFSAPKSISVAYATADPQMRAWLDREAEEAARVAVDRITAPELTTRVGHAGAEREPVSVAAAMYVQHLSRDNDPQLHVHVIIPNFGWGPDGQVRTIESRWLYESQRAGSMSFHAELVQRMRDAGYDLRVDGEGVVRVEGIDERLEDLFSKRAAAIDQATREKYGVSRDDAAPWQRDSAAVTTRQPHDLGYREDWREQAIAAGLSAEWDRAAAAHEAARGAVRDRARDPEALDRVTDAAIRDLLHGTDRLAATGLDSPGRALTARHHLVAEVAARARDVGGGIDDVLGAVRRAEERGATVTLDRSEHGVGLRDRYSTPDFIQREHEMLRQFRQMANRVETGHGVAVAERLRDGLSAEQQRALDAMTADRRVALIEGLAGVGKTQVLERVREAYASAGFRVVGETHTGIAAQQLGDRAGIESRTIALAEKRGRDINDRTVLVVDEFQTVSSPQMSRLVDDIRTSGAKLVLVGDPGRAAEREDPGLPGQHVAVGPGVPARHLADVVRELAPEPSSIMLDIRRQENPDLRHVALLAATGRGADALRETDSQGRLAVTNTSDAMRREAAVYVADAIRDGRSALAIVGSRQEERAVNAATREELRSRGVLGEDAATYRIGSGKRTRDLALAPGDRVGFMRNDYDLGVRTGQRAEVVAIERSGDVLLRLDGERADRDGHPIFTRVDRFGDYIIQDRTREVVLARAEVERLVRGRELLGHDYARTSHRAQGATVDRAVVAFHHESAALSRQFGAVALTRSREDLRVAISAEGAEARDRDPAAERPHWPRDRKRPDDRQQQLFVDPDVRKAALREAGARLGRDAPGETTLSYRDAPERAAEARTREAMHLRSERVEREPAVRNTVRTERDGDHDDRSERTRVADLTRVDIRDWARHMNRQDPRERSEWERDSERRQASMLRRLRAEEESRDERVDRKEARTRRDAERDRNVER
jgi:conjugative relaxase-like TrwC/TraI family protein